MICVRLKFVTTKLWDILWFIFGSPKKNDLPFYVKLKYDDTVDGRNPAPVDR